MRLKLISCEALAHEMLVAIRRSVNQVEPRFLPNSMHSFGCRFMRPWIQDLIDSSAHGDYHAILLGYGLCSHGVAGLKARTVPLVIPRAPEKWEFWQNGRRAYSYCCRTPATGRNKNSMPPHKAGEANLSPQDLFARVRTQSRSRLKAATGMGRGGQCALKRKFAETGREPGAAAVDRGAWDVGNRLEKQAQEEAEWFGWDFERADDELSLIQRLMDGYWSHHEFLVVPPGWQVVANSGNGNLLAEQVIS